MPLASGQKRTVRISYQGKDKLDRETPYRLIAEQLPIKFGENAEGSGKNSKQQSAEIFVLLKYMAALYVRPSGVAPNVKLEKFTQTGQEFLVTLSNQGTEHYILQNPVFKVTAKGQAASELNSKDHAEALKEVVGQNLLPHSKRTFKIKIPKSIAGNTVHENNLQGLMIGFDP